MKINKVTLNNYRCHRETTVEFDDGLNLLLGKNGTGKSSVLEAIGYAMFGAPLRSQTEAEAVRLGSDRGQITVEFTGNDGLDYIVERRLRSTGHFLFKKGETFPLVSGRDEVVKKASELAGLANNTKILYQNIVVASQNQLTNIFAETPKNREEIFNGIFETDIYRKIFEGYAKTALENYRLGLSNNHGKRQAIESVLKDSSQLESMLGELSQKTKATGSVISDKKAILDSLELERQRLDEINNLIERISGNIENMIKLIAARIGERRSAEHDRQASEQSLAELNKYQHEYDKYKTVSIEARKLTGQITKLEAEEGQKLALEKQLAELEKKEASIDSTLKSKNEEIAKKATDVIEANQEVVALQSTIKELESELNSIALEAAHLENSYNQLKKYHSDIKQCERKKEMLETRLDSTVASLVDPDSLDRQAKELKSQVTLLLSQKEEKQSLEGILKNIETRLTDNADAAKVLAEGTCPYLQEKCLNIGEGNAADRYFANKMSQLNDSQEDLKNKLENFKNVDSNLIELRRQIAILENKKSEVKKSLEESALLRSDIELSRKDMEIARLKLLQMAQPYAGKFDCPVKDLNPDTIEQFFTTELMSVRQRLSGKKATFEEKSSALSKAKSSLTKLEKQVDILKSDTIKLVKEIDAIKQKKSEQRIKIESLTEATAMLPQLKQSYTAMSNELNSLQKGYDNYVKNEISASKLDEHTARIKSLDEAIEKLAVEKSGLETRLATLKTSFSKETYEECKSNIVRSKYDIDKLQTELSEYVTKMKIAEKELEENKSNLIKLESLNREIAAMDRKIDLTKKLRDNLNEMGSLVASRLLTQVSLLATENYRRISGSSEEIRWLVDSAHKYEVVFHGNASDTGRRFQVLSGGEQVSVAISLRAAMATLLTRTQLAVFDEPTVNLDVDRRAALADSLRQMLKSLSQAIIVTHDDTFREMAQKIIYFSSDVGDNKIPS